MDVALGAPGRPTGALATGLPRPAARRGRRAQAGRHRLLRPPGGKQGRRARPGAGARLRPPLHPRLRAAVHHGVPMTVRASYFDGMYADSPDPWGFTSRWYEGRKYAITVAMLPKARYREAFEPGCSIGVLSDLLALRCGHLLCCDIAPAAVKAAAERTAGHGHVEVQQRGLREDWPEGQVELLRLYATR